MTVNINILEYFFEKNYFFDRVFVAEFVIEIIYSVWLTLNFDSFFRLNLQFRWEASFFFDDSIFGWWVDCGEIINWKLSQNFNQELFDKWILNVSFKINFSKSSWSTFLNNFNFFLKMWKIKEFTNLNQILTLSFGPKTGIIQN